LHVGAAPRPAGRTAARTVAEDAAEHVTEALAALAEEVAQVERRAAPGAGPTASRDPEAAEHRAGLVVLLALLLVGQHVVRFGDLLEAILRLRAALVRLGVPLPCELTIGLLDLGGRRGLRHTQRLVVVLLVVLRAHLASLGCLVVPIFYRSPDGHSAASPLSSGPVVGAATATRAGRKIRSPTLQPGWKISTHVS